MCALLMTQLPEEVPSRTNRKNNNNKKKNNKKEAAARVGSPSALCGNLVGGVHLAGGVIGPCGPT